MSKSLGKLFGSPSHRAIGGALGYWYRHLYLINRHPRFLSAHPVAGQYLFFVPAHDNPRTVLACLFKTWPVFALTPPVVPR